MSVWLIGMWCVSVSIWWLNLGRWLLLRFIVSSLLMLFVLLVSRWCMVVIVCCMLGGGVDDLWVVGKWLCMWLCVLLGVVLGSCELMIWLCLF